MKKIISVVVLLLLFSCKGQDKKGTELVAPAAFEQQMQAEEGQVVDVRTPGEYNSGHIKGAVNLHIYDKDFETRLDSLDKTETVYVYCKAGGRSAEAVQAMKAKGFEHIVELQGGMDAWNEAAKPVEK